METKDREPDNQRFKEPVSIIKNFSSDLGENMLIIEDVCINAKGYKDILEHKYKVVV